MKELDCVKLTKALGKIKEGTLGVIVHEYDGSAFEVEYFDKDNETIDVITTPADYLVLECSFNKPNKKNS
jgi:hypothetical protein